MVAFVLHLNEINKKILLQEKNSSNHASNSKNLYNKTNSQQESVKGTLIKPHLHLYSIDKPEAIAVLVIAQRIYN